MTPVVYSNLSDYLEINSHGLQEIKLDMTHMLIKGSDSFMSDVE